MEDFGAAISVGANSSFFGQWVMTPVGDQLRLDSCSTFAVSDHVSAKLAIDHPGDRLQDAIVFSKQELFDCCLRRTCGVLFRQAYDYIRSSGLHREAVYPYLGLADQPCRCPDLDDQKVGILDWHHISGEATVLASLERQPLAASILVYDSLVEHEGLAVWGPEEGEEPYRDEGSKHPSRHAVLLTGYGVDEDGVAYYIGKGSWGVDVWLNGYIRIRRDVPFFYF